VDGGARPTGICATLVGVSRLRVLGVVLSGLVVLGVLVLQAGRGPERRGPEPVPASRTTGPAGVSVLGRGTSAAALRTLRDWDRGRARAYATGSPERLRDLYVVGSGAGAADLRLLGAYRSRGARVVGMRTQVLALVVLDARPDRWALRVTDRLARAVAVQDGRRRNLPRDASSTRVITLMRGPDDRWRVSSVSDA
jgi:hypothetical protein